MRLELIIVLEVARADQLAVVDVGEEADEVEELAASIRRSATRP